MELTKHRGLNDRVTKLLLKQLGSLALKRPISSLHNPCNFLVLKQFFLLVLKGLVQLGRKGFIRLGRKGFTRLGQKGVVRLG
jgi:hypothetical protein